jgi:cell division protein FtsI (penicillin-binding protein 3)
VNRPIRSAYEPGSVFKIFSIASFLELGGIDFDDTFFCDGNYPDVDPPIHDLRPHGEVNARNILKYSCNVGAAYASETVTADGFYSLLRRFGFGKRTGIALTGENPGSLKESRKWSGRTKPTIAFGQELNVNAVQMISAATVFCNSGILLKPLVVKKIVAPDGKLIKRYNRQEVAEVLSPEIAAEILSIMESATDAGGTARLAKIEGIRISAKTGTAQIFDVKKGKYLEDRHIASFLGILPASDPQLIIYVVINSPQVALDYGSRVAAPVFKETAERLITLMGLSYSRIIEHSGRVLVPELEGIVVGKQMPDLTGMPKRKLLSLLTRDDIKVLFKGEGYVVSQKPRPGEPVDPGMTLILEFE